MTDIPAEAMTVPLDRPDPDSEVGGYVAATGHVSPDYGARVRAAAVFSQLDETLAPQLLVDAIAATPPGSALDSSRADALALLGEAARDSFQLPREGLSLVCEVCGDVAVIQGRRRRWAAYVAWAQLDMGASDDFEDFIPRLLDLPSGNESTAGEVADLRRLRFDQPDGPVRSGGRQLIRRLTLACDRCVRRQREGGGLHRCRHEAAAAAGEWRRCRRVAVTKDYCAEHRAPEVSRARKQYARAVEAGVTPGIGHRRAGSDVPSIVATDSDRGRYLVHHDIASKGPEWFAAAYRQRRSRNGAPRQA